MPLSMKVSTALLASALLAPFGPAGAADLALKPSKRVVVRKETRIVRPACLDPTCGPVYVTRMLRTCTVRAAREWRDGRWQLRSAPFCPGEMEEPLIAIRRGWLPAPATSRREHFPAKRTPVRREIMRREKTWS